MAMLECVEHLPPAWLYILELLDQPSLKVIRLQHADIIAMKYISSNQ